MRIIAILFALFSFAFARADEVDLGSRGVLSIAVPEGWRLTAKKAGDVGYGAALKPLGNAHAKCLLTIAFLHRPESIDSGAIQKTVLSTGDSMVHSSAARQLRVDSLQLKSGYGAYVLFSGSDLRQQPEKKDDYRAIGTGVARPTDELIVVITVYADSSDGAEMQAILRALSSMAVTKT